MNSEIIGPVNIRFNIESLLTKLEEDKFSIQSLTWIFDDEEKGT